MPIVVFGPPPLPPPAYASIHAAPWKMDGECVCVCISRSCGCVLDQDLLLTLPIWLPVRILCINMRFTVFSFTWHVQTADLPFSQISYKLSVYHIVSDKLYQTVTL